MLYLVHDDFTGNARLAAIRAAVGPSDVAEFNITRIDGMSFTLGELRAAADTAPFLAERRLVEVGRLIGRTERRPQESATESGRSETTATGRPAHDPDLLAYLRQLPETTDVVFFEAPTVTASHPLHKLAREVGEVVSDPPLDDEELVGWILERARIRGGEIEPAAAVQLARCNVGGLRDFDVELRKLTTYAGERSVQAEDVRLLVRASREPNVFEMVDAIGHRNARRALAELHRLLDEGEPPPVLSVMLARQLRLLIQARELIEQGKRPDEMASAMRQKPFVARKMADQARSLSLAWLERAYAELVATEEDVKRGRIEPVAALDLFVAEQTRGR